MSGGANTVCTIYKDFELSHKTKYVITAVRFRGQWVFVRSHGTAAYQMIGGPVRNNESPETALRRELYIKAGIVAGKIYGISSYSLSTGNRRIGTAGRTTTYGKLYYTECVCMGKAPNNKTEEILFSENELSFHQYLHPDTYEPLMRKTKSWLGSGAAETSVPFAFEKLCGAVTYCRENGIVKYILIKNLSGHIGFPKGHAENGESELETARREVFEETGLTPEIFTDFRYHFKYVAPSEANGSLPGADMHKLAVYFTARFTREEIPQIKIQEEEVLKWWFVPYGEAMKLLNKNADKRMLELANRWIEQNRM
ncbi:MAG: NUDIX domain-containing protein [Clostridia bacterium]